MKKLVLMCVVLAVASSAYATQYNWVGVWTDAGNGQNAENWDNPASWSVGVGFPSTSADCAIIQNGAYVADLTQGLATPYTVTIGALVVGNGASLYMWNRAFTINIVDDGGLSGDFWYRSTAAGTVNQNPLITLNVDGNVYNAYGSGLFGPNGVPKALNMYGNGKAIKLARSSSSWAGGGQNMAINLYGTSIWDNASSGGAQQGETLTVTSGASIGSHATIAGNWYQRRFILEGATPAARQAQLPALKSNVNFNFGSVQSDNGPLSKRTLTVLGGIIYPQDVGVGIGYNQNAVLNPNHIWRIKGGDVTVGRDFKFQSPAGASSYKAYFSTEDNDTPGTYRNMTIMQDMKIANADYRVNEPYLFMLNSSTVKVGRDLLVGMSSTQQNGAIDLGSGTLRIGRNLTINNPVQTNGFTLANWNAGTSTIICDGNSTSTTTTHFNQTLTTYGDCGIALNNLIINTDCTVSLANSAAGILLLKGDLDIQAGTFNDNDRQIRFNGPAHLLKVNPSAAITGGAFDDLVLLPNAVINLGSDITADNIDLQLGSQIYLLGFTLNADGTSWVSADTPDFAAGGVAYELGTIYGTMSNEIPEPGTLLLLGTGVLGALGYIRRRRMA